MSRALEDRLAEVRGRQAALAGTRPGVTGSSAVIGRPGIAGPVGVTGPADAAGPDGSAEDLLRVAMTRLWPRARSAGGREDWLALFDALQGLEAAARTDDWRFLDAWSNAFEALAAASCPDALRPRAAAFLDAYAALLALHLARLQGKS
jgi:hypothetical protein